MIRISKLVKNYKDIKALDSLDLEIKKGSIFGLLGPNGAGKTSLVSILNALINFDEGEVFVKGMSLKTKANEIRNICSLIPQSLALYDNLSVQENLRFFAQIQNLRGVKLQKSIDYALEINRLSSMRDRRAGTLSGGQKRRLNIAIGLLNSPEILFFDEPTVGIDPESRNEILETIASFKDDNKTVIYTSHYMSEIEKICDDIAIINAGKILKQGSLNSFVQEDNKHVYIDINEKSSLKNILSSQADMTFIDTKTLSLSSNESKVVSNALLFLEINNVSIKQVRYAHKSLESVFIELTSKGRSDV